MTDQVPHSEPARVSANGIELVYDTFGEPSAPPLLLIMGLGAQMTAWHDDFCGGLAGRGFRVIRFDNRDCGLSTCFEDADAPSFLSLAWSHLTGRPMPAPYTLRDMAADAAGLLQALGASPAHIVGASLGGMIAQGVAIYYPECVRTLTSIMSTTSERGLPLPRPRTFILFRQSPEGREGAIEHGIKVSRALRGGGFPFDEAEGREQGGRAYDRARVPGGAFRQMAAIMMGGSRKEALRSVKAPTLVLHGAADPLLPPKHGIATARAIPGAELQLIQGMGHELPREAWPQVIEAIAAHAKRG